ncbi:uncharacterized protein Dvar_34220 [Desulfosarcina variabilis str. Montpellier]|uniref:putative transposase n=1 Tax=Desulfosarcina variabilis TaxID=2300 RepID=UPI003AFB014E
MGMGTACTRVMDRALASIGQGEAQVRCEPCLDVPKAEVLCAMPALLANGILEGAEKLLGKSRGYYTIFQILLVLAFMTLCRYGIECDLVHRPGGSRKKSPPAMAAQSRRTGSVKDPSRVRAHKLFLLKTTDDCNTNVKR